MTLVGNEMPRLPVTLTPTIKPPIRRELGRVGRANSVSCGPRFSAVKDAHRRDTLPGHNSERRTSPQKRLRQDFTDDGGGEPRIAIVRKRCEAVEVADHSTFIDSNAGRLAYSRFRASMRPCRGPPRHRLRVPPSHDPDPRASVVEDAPQLPAP